MTFPDPVDGARQNARAEDFLRLRLAQGPALGGGDQSAQRELPEESHGGHHDHT
jgi:hypothetical protein